MIFLIIFVFIQTFYRHGKRSNVCHKHHTEKKQYCIVSNVHSAFPKSNVHNSEHATQQEMNKKSYLD